MTYDDLSGGESGETSAEIKERTDRARAIQRERYAGENVNTNSEMSEKDIRKFCALSKECDDILREAFTSLRLSARARSRILKVARTIADLAMEENILPEHVMEAVSYRTYGAEEE